MRRFINSSLDRWANSEKHKPIMLRGARQVGKTFAVRQLGKKFSSYVEINCEEINVKNIFSKDLKPTRLVAELALVAGQPIIPGKTLLFIDEIQEEPRAILALRYFYEQMPQLHIIAAGSLLDFALENVGMPVGRVDSYYMYPLTWLEFLLAKKEDLLYEAIFQYTPEQPIPASVHQKLLNLLGEYLALGGMPEVVNTWIESNDPYECFKVLSSLLDSYRSDFEKYALKHQIKYVELLFDQVPRQLGNKFKFSHVPGEYRKRELSPCYDLLVKAGVVHTVYHSSANGLPLGAEVNLAKFKAIFLDIGLAQNLLGLDVKNWLIQPEKAFINQGSIVESFIGQEILAYAEAFRKKSLYYWQRESRGSESEVDYVTQIKSNIIPLEVKSGTKGSLKGLREYLKCHTKTAYSIRFSSQNYSKYDHLYSYPLYAVAQAVNFASIVDLRQILPPDLN